MTRIRKNAVLIGLVLSLSAFAVFGAIPDSFKDIGIVLPTKMKGWSGKRPDGSSITYHVSGISYMASTDGSISSKYTWNLMSPPTLTEAQSNPFKMVQYVACLLKKGDHAGMMKLVDSTTDPKTIAILNRPDLVRAELDAYTDKTEGGMFVGFQQDDSTVIIYYYLQSTSDKLLQMDRLKKLNGLYVLEPSDSNPKDNRPINIFTALYDTLKGISKDIQITL